MGDDKATPAAEKRDAAFFITRIGEPGTAVRRRTDDVERFILKPVLDPKNIDLVRADKDPTPGRISDRIVQSIIGARLVIADVTGHSPNVFYELGIAHAFTKPVIPLIDTADAIPFDTIDQNHIIVGDEGTLGAAAAEAAKATFATALEAVLKPGFEPTSPVTGASRRAVLAKLDNPRDRALADMQQQIDVILSLLLREQERPSRASQWAPTFVRTPKDFPASAVDIWEDLGLPEGTRLNTPAHEVILPVNHGFDRVSILALRNDIERYGWELKEPVF